MEPASSTYGIFVRDRVIGTDARYLVALCDFTGNLLHGTQSVFTLSSCADACGIVTSGFSELGPLRCPGADCWVCPRPNFNNSKKSVQRRCIPVNCASSISKRKESIMRKVPS